MNRVWITRAEPGATDSARRVRDQGLEPIVAPLLEVLPLGDGPLDLAGVAALAFTSANGLRAFVARSDERGLPVFAVGDATAATARALGFQFVESAAGDVAALARLIARSPLPNGVVLHLSARDAAGDLKANLRAVGVLARRLNIYETVERELPPDRVDEIALADAVLLHSPRAARRLSEAYGRMIGPQCAVICLSHAIAAALTEIAPRTILIARAPNETALLTCLTAQLTKA